MLHHCIRTILTAGWLISAIQQASAETVPLSTLDLKQMTTGWGEPQIDRGIADPVITIDGKQFAHGIGTHAVSKLRIDVGGNAKRFVAQVGLDDSAKGQGSIEFVVLGDNRVLWKSGILTGMQPAVPVDVDLAGVK